MFSFSDKYKRPDRRVHFGRIRTHIPREESWLQAYGWSMPADPSNGRPLLSMPQQSNSPSTNYPVPVLVNCCSPLADTEPGMKVNINLILTSKKVKNFIRLIQLVLLYLYFFLLFMKQLNI